MGYQMNYEERETVKNEARKILDSEDANIPKKAWALLRLIDAHYYRAREHLEMLSKAEQRKIHGKRYCKGYELDIDVYTTHWLHSMGDKFMPEVVKYLCDEYCYKPVASKFLPKEKTIYDVKNAKILTPSPVPPPQASS